MTKRDSHETPNMYPNLSAILLIDQQQFRLNKSLKLKNILLLELKKKELMSKRE